MRTSLGGQMKVKKGIFKKCFILQFLIVGIFIIIGFTEFRAGEEFQVNTFVTGNQGIPAIAMNRKGNFVITWLSDGQDGDGFGIFAQRFKSSGKPLGPEFQVNTNSFGDQFYPAIAMDRKGNFVITWESEGQDGDRGGIFAQRFNKNGKPIGSEFQVNTYTEHIQGSPEIAMHKKGNFVITWNSYGQDGSIYGVFAKMFKKQGKSTSNTYQHNQ
jgi:hypothetical protein